LYFILNKNDPVAFQNAHNLVDSFIPEEKKKRVKIEHIRFYISGNRSDTEKKVTINMILSLMPRIGAPNMKSSESKMQIQTTLSERFYKLQ
jgi:hypothetical protein